MVKVGTVAGRTPYYSRLPSSTYGRFLEIDGVGRRRDRYPFLLPAAEFACRIPGPMIFRTVLGALGL
jgi:hypothetical protein